jgi:Mrp family chromosome partitioning ATPase
MRRDITNVIAAPSTGPADSQFDLAALGRALWRRKRWIIIPTALAAGAAAIFVTLTTPIFRSEALVLIVTFAAMMSAVTLICLGELLSGDPLRAARMPAERVLPAELAYSEPVWIGAASDAETRRTGAKSPTRDLATLAEHACRLGRGIFVVTSEEGGERAWSAAIDLAREIGREGERVLFMDFDLERARGVREPGGLGVSDLLFGVANFGEVIQRDSVSTIHVIPAGRGSRGVAALLAGERLAIALGALSQTYDHVVLFVPALSTLAGGARLARFSRGVVLIAAEGSESLAAAASDALRSRGFANVAVATVSEATPPEDVPRAAAWANQSLRGQRNLNMSADRSPHANPPTRQCRTCATPPIGRGSRPCTFPARTTCCAHYSAASARS